MGAALAVQWLAILALAGLAGLGFGLVAARSLLYGGAAVAVPNALLALWLTLRLRRAGTLGMTAMVGGELLKLLATIALLALAVQALGREASWLALLAGVVGALKAQWLAVWFTRRL